MERYLNEKALIKKKMVSVIQNKLVVLIGLYFVLSMPFVLGESVTRSFQVGSVNPGDSLSVNLVVDVDPDTTSYSIEEVFPAGWYVTNMAGGSVDLDGVLRITSSSPADRTHTYNLEVPQGALNQDPYNKFSGEYGIVKSGSGTVDDINPGPLNIQINGATGTDIRVGTPIPSTVRVGENPPETFSVEIFVDKAVNMYGVQFDLVFDDSVLDFQDGVKSTELLGQSLNGGNVYGSGDSGFTAIDVQPGRINDFIVLRSGVSTGVTDDGQKRIATFTFIANGVDPSPGSVLLDIENTIFSDPNAISIPVNNEVDGSIVVSFCGDGEVEGNEQCDVNNCEDGTLCPNGNSDCAGIGAGLCLPRDGGLGSPKCSSICTTEICETGNRDICTDGKICPGNIVPSADSPVCCDEQCIPTSWNFCSECGNGVLNGCDRVECGSIDGSPQDGSPDCFFVENDNIFTFWVTEGICGECSGASCNSYDDDQTSCTDNVCGFSSPSCEWGGSSCQAVGAESICNDGIDNDGDSFVDCLDPDCAGQDGPADGGACCPTGQDAECTTTCEACNAVTKECGAITAEDGTSCNNDCTYCDEDFPGECRTRSVNDFTECTEECNACDGVGLNCAPDTFDEGQQCLNPGRYCDNGVCCNDANGDNVCDACSVSTDCNDGIVCTIDSCDSGTTGQCDYDIAGCDCAGKDYNSDGSLSVADLRNVIINDINVNGDTDPETGEELINVLDLVEVATLFNVCQ